MYTWCAHYMGTFHIALSILFTGLVRLRTLHHLFTHQTFLLSCNILSFISRSIAKFAESIIKFLRMQAVLRCTFQETQLNELKLCPLHKPFTRREAVVTAVLHCNIARVQLKQAELILPTRCELIESQQPSREDPLPSANACAETLKLLPKLLRIHTKTQVHWQYAGRLSPLRMRPAVVTAMYIRFHAYINPR